MKNIFIKGRRRLLVKEKEVLEVLDIINANVFGDQKLRIGRSDTADNNNVRYFMEFNSNDESWFAVTTELENSGFELVVKSSYLDYLYLRR